MEFNFSNCLKVLFFSLLLPLLGFGLGASQLYILSFFPTGGSKGIISAVGFKGVQPSAVERGRYLTHLLQQLRSSARRTTEKDTFITFELADESITRAEFQKMIDNTNAFFDPIEVKKREDLGKQQAKEKSEKYAAELKQKAEEKRIMEEKEKRLKLIALKPKSQEMLHDAILKDSESDIIDAITAGANIDFGIGNQPPLLLAVLLGKAKSVHTLLNNGAKGDVSYQGKPLVLYAIKNGDLASALYIVERGADFSGNIDGLDAFTYVSSNFNAFTPGTNKQISFDLMSEMVRKGYDIQRNFNNKDLKNNAFYLAIKNNQVNHMGCFWGFEGQMKDNPCISLSVANANQVFVLPDGSTWTPALIIIKSLIENKNQLNTNFSGQFNLNQKAKPDGKTLHSPLSYLLLNYPQDHLLPMSGILDLFLNKGANLAEAIDIFIKNGGSKDYALKSTWQGSWNLLGVAIYYKEQDAVTKLIEAGADINSMIDPFPLPHGRAEIQSYDASKDPYSHMRGPHTPLFYALQLGTGEIIETLLKYGAHM